MAFIPSRIKKHNTDPGNLRLNLTSMMDMFTIILLFLLKTYSTEGQLIHPSETLQLPKSTVERSPEVALDVVVSRDQIIVNEKPVVSMEEVRAQRGFLIPKLQKELKFYANEARKMEENFGIKFSGKVTIQGDRRLPYRDLVKVMYTAGRSDYPNMRLVVYRKEEQESM
jgi:biopolymer transport protein ExbD